MKGKLEKKTEHWGAELAFTEHFLEQRPTHSCRLLFWSDWSGSEAPSNLIVRLVVRTTGDMPVPRGIGLHG